MPEAAKTLSAVGRYALSTPLAAGGMATVHLGRLMGEAGFSRTVAIKRLHPQFAADADFVSMFVDEARLAARIHHPNAVQVLDVVSTGGELFLVMDYVPGESLSRVLRVLHDRHEHGLTPPIAVAIACGVLQGLHAAHEATNEHGQPLGIVHRDVSPQNVIVGSDGTARVLDFGVAKAAGRLQTTRDGAVKGKLAYMPPEQVRSQTVTRRTDVYAASVVLWEMLTGARLFAAPDDAALLYLVLEGKIDLPSVRGEKWHPPEWLEQLRALDPIVMMGLSRDSDARFDSALQMALALEKTVRPASTTEVSDWLREIASDTLMARARLVTEMESSSSRSSAMPLVVATEDSPTLRSVPGRPALIAAAVAAAAVLAGGLWFALRPAPQPAAVAPPPPVVAAPVVEVPAAAPPPMVQPPAPAAPAAKPAAKPAVVAKPKPRKPAGPDCSQPYTYDSDGKKHVRPECL